MNLNSEALKEMEAGTEMKMESDVNVHIRWMIRRDMPEVYEIDSSVFEFPWAEEDFLRCLRQRNCIGMVAEFDEQIVGFMVYELHKDQIHVLNFATRVDSQRQGVGRQMVNKLTAKLSRQYRKQIVLEVRETNLSAQVFFGKCGFKATSILRDYYNETCEDAYVMRYEYGLKVEPAASNRISRLA